MLAPEPEPPTHLQRFEVEAAVARFAQDASEMARGRKLARLLAHGLPAMDAEDLLQNAFILLLTGSRRWPRGLAALVMLKGVMRSVASNARKKPNYVLAEDLGYPFDEDSEEECSPVAEGASPQADPARIVEAESDMATIQSLVAGDEELELLTEALADGLTGMNIATELGWDGKKYD